jgi:ribosomal subunit interface protein
MTHITDCQINSAKDNVPNFRRPIYNPARQSYSGVGDELQGLFAAGFLPTIRDNRGSAMKIDISYKNVEAPSAVEPAVERHVDKIAVLLQAYDPDLVQLHGSFEKHPRRASYAFDVSVSLPTGTLHATGEAPDPLASARKGFSELESQIKKHQSRLRKDYEWKRKRPTRARLAES